ncbi:heparinase II/III family protein, partial [Endozoicomonas sp. ONNA1]|uniref:heparinase II/III family protein n=1 Tax=Endozoicomonas sp. ONNA1 TaxID=2828740 RepID=UPI002147DFFB
LEFKSYFSREIFCKIFFEFQAKCFNISEAPKNGELKFSGDSFYYIPKKDFSGSDGFIVNKKRYNINVENTIFDSAAEISLEAYFLCKNYKSINRKTLIESVYAPVPYSDLALQKNNLRLQILNRPPSAYVVLNEVSAYADRDKQVYGYPNYPELSLKLPIDWATKKPPFNTRSWRYGFNAWVFMDSLLSTGDIDDLVYAKKLMMDWIDFNIIQKKVNEFSWYDMGVAFRATRIPYIIEHCLRNNLLSDEEFYLSSLALQIHILDLANLDKLALHSNHGLYQLCGLLAITNTLPEIKNRDLYDAFAKYHFSQTVLKDVNSEGVHLEHSPDYHVYISDILFSAIKAGWVTDPLAIERVQKMNSVNFMLLHPNNKAVRFGDTSERDFRSIINKQVPELFYIYRNGKEGKQPKVHNLVLPESG